MDTCGAQRYSIGRTIDVGMGPVEAGLATTLGHCNESQFWQFSGALAIELSILANQAPMSIIAK